MAQSNICFNSGFSKMNSPGNCAWARGEPHGKEEKST